MAQPANCTPIVEEFSAMYLEMTEEQREIARAILRAVKSKSIPDEEILALIHACRDGELSRDGLLSELKRAA